MSHFNSRFVNTNGISIHYFRSLAINRPVTFGDPILMLHGVTDNGMCWERVALALHDRYDIIMMDARGHGKTDSPENGYGIEDRAADVAGLIDGLDLKRVVLLGHSMGAETATATAAAYPSKIRALLLEDPPWPGRFWGSTPEEREERAAAWEQEIIHRRSLSKEQIIAEGKRANPNWSEVEWSAWADSKLQLSAYISKIATAPRRRWTDYLGSTRCPILLLMGDPALGGIINPKTASEAERWWTSGKIIQIPGAGHNIRRDQFEAFIGAVEEFLANVNDGELAVNE